VFVVGVRLGGWGVVLVVCVCVCRGRCSLSVCVCVCVCVCDLSIFLPEVESERSRGSKELEYRSRHIKTSMQSIQLRKKVNGPRVNPNPNPNPSSKGGRFVVGVRSGVRDVVRVVCVCVGGVVLCRCVCLTC